MLDYSSDEYFVILYYFKTEKCKYNFFYQSVVDLVCRVQGFTTSLQQFMHYSVFTNTFQTLPEFRSGAVMNFTRPNNILLDLKKPNKLE